MNKALVVVDMQNDFITGALANEEGQKIVPKIAEYIRNFDGKIYVTKDSHDEHYMDTMEGKKLPVPHCILGTEGHDIVAEIYAALKEEDNFKTIIKLTFGSTDLAEELSTMEDIDEIILCGVCTDICVISNALLIKAFCPNTKITVLKDLCAGVTPESHETALKAMAACHIDIE